MSTFSDVAGTVEEEGKGRAPKEVFTCTIFLGHEMKNFMTVIFAKRWGAIRTYRKFLNRPHFGRFFFRFLIGRKPAHLGGKKWLFLQAQGLLL